MLYKKFIITRAGYLRLGSVNMHRDLLLPGDKCLGGGMWDIDYVDNCLALSGRSYDFGAPRWDEITTLYVPSAYRSMGITYDGKPIGEIEFAAIKVKYYEETFF